MHCYCMYCTTAKCEFVAESLTAMGFGRAIMPKIVQRKWVKGTAREEVHSYLPGYVFLYSDAPVSDFLAIRRLTDVHRILGNEADRYELQGSDRAFAEMLLASDGTIGILKAYEAGDRVQGVITKFDRSRRRAEIEFDFDGKKQRVWCGIELITDVRKDAEPSI